MLKQENGVTLLILAIAVVVLLIIAGIATYSGVSNVEYTKVSNAKVQLKVMQAEVNSWYQQYKNGNEDVLSYGNKDISQYGDLLKKLGISDTSDYRFFSADYIKNNLGVDGISFDMIINVKNRKIILADGVKQDGKTYYTLEDFGISNVGM